MRFPRSAGILLHPTPLPYPNGIGEIGPDAFAFADWLAGAGQKVWQVLPLGPTGYGDSPYQCFPAFAGGDSTRTAADIAAEREFTRRYLSPDGTEMIWVFIRTIMASIADTVLIPMQDLLGLGSEARMNLQESPDGNWQWRMRAGSLREEDAARLRGLAEMYDR